MKQWHQLFGFQVRRCGWILVWSLMNHLWGAQNLSEERSGDSLSHHHPTPPCMEMEHLFLIVSCRWRVRVCLHEASASMWHQCCDNTCDTALIDHTGVAPFPSYFIVSNETLSQASSQRWHYIDAYAWCKHILTMHEKFLFYFVSRSSLTFWNTTHCTAEYFYWKMWQGN